MPPQQCTYSHGADSAAEPSEPQRSSQQRVNYPLGSSPISKRFPRVLVDRRCRTVYSLFPGASHLLRLSEPTLSSLDRSRTGQSRRAAGWVVAAVLWLAIGADLQAQVVEQAGQVTLNFPDAVPLKTLADYVSQRLRINFPDSLLGKPHGTRCFRTAGYAVFKVAASRGSGCCGTRWVRDCL